ncbi:MAG: ribosome biogenesis GTP-binding protein YihA/YsxC [Bacillota bacterium]|nr:ribosome biogenesis GTP-binding protein YihA/YsxC [Bacillota bacterium]
MNLNNLSIEISAVSPKQYPQSGMFEIAFSGRSNVGKSSFLNKMVGRKSLARTSGKPGKTAQINFFNIDDTIYFVDLPGYGYASVSKAEQQRWGTMINTYLSTREQLRQTVLLVDSRHKPTNEDFQMAKWIRHRFGYLVIVATKTDKLSKTQLEENLNIIEKTLRLTNEDYLIPFSAETGLGKEDCWGLFCSILGCDMPILR